MLPTYINQASKQLSPAYNTQIGALNSQIPAIQKLFQVLMQSLQGQQQVGNQNILEAANGRGILRSTIPVDNQATLAGQILSQGNQYALQQQQQIGQIQGQVAGLGVDRANSISNLANTLYGQYLQKTGQQQQNQYNTLQLKQQRQLADRQYQLDKAAI